MDHLQFNRVPGLSGKTVNPKPSRAGTAWGGSWATMAAFLLACMAPFIASAASPTATQARGSGAGGSRIAAHYGQIPLSFEANQGQADAGVQFLSRGSGYTLFLAPGEVALSLQRQQAVTAALKPGQTPEAAPLDTLRMRLVGADAHAAAAGVDPQPGVVSYFIGNDPKKWHAGIKTFGRVNYASIYPGVDLVFYGNQRQLEFDFVVAPGADASRIVWQVEGASATVDAEGDLVLTAAHGPASFEKPVVYQMDGGRRVPVDGAFQVAGSRIGFKLGAYNHAKALIIDPVLAYGSYLGGSGLDNIGNTVNGDGNPSQALAVDSEGSAYVTGYTYSTNFPVKDPIEGAPKKTDPRYAWAFVSKFSPDGSSLAYSTYLAGSDNDLGYAIAVDSAGAAYITGLTSSPDFPVTGGSYQTICGGNWTESPKGVFTRTTSCPGYESAFVTKLSPEGTALAYSTFLSGYQGSVGNAIAVDASGRAYVTGYTHEACAAPPAQPAFCPFPTTAGAIISGSATGGDSPDYIFVSVFDPTGSQLLYSTLYGDLNGIGPKANLGSGGTYATAIAVDGNDNFYVAGYTQAGALLTTSGVLQPKSGPYANGGRSLLSQRGYIAKFNALKSGSSSLAYGTYLGGHQGYTADNVFGIAVDSTGSVYLSGSTNSGDFPVTPGAFQTICGIGKNNVDCSAAFVSKLNPAASALDWSSYLGNTPALDNYGIDGVGPVAIDKNGDVYVIGKTAGIYYFVNPVEPSAALGTAQAFITEFNPTGSKLLFSSYVGSSSNASYDNPAGLAVDGEGNIYVAGDNEAGGLITTPGAFQTTYGGGASDGFVVKIAPHGTATTTLTATPNPAAYQAPVTLKAVVAPTGVGSVPTGTVKFMDGTTVWNTTTLDATGTATYTAPLLRVGSYSLTAEYSGDNTYPANTSAVTSLIVGKAATTTTLTAAPNPAFAEQIVALSALVTPASGSRIPAGKVTFLDGAKVIGAANLNSAGKAMLQTAALAAGIHSVTAVYGGGSLFLGSTSTAVVVTINAKIATTTTLATSAKSVVAGASVTFTATIKPSTGSVVPTGTVTFKDGATVLGPGTLNGSGVATLATSTLAVGQHSVRAYYGGDVGDGSSASAAVTVTVTAK